NGANKKKLASATSMGRERLQDVGCFHMPILRKPAGFASSSRDAFAPCVVTGGQMVQLDGSALQPAPWPGGTMRAGAGAMPYGSVTQAKLAASFGEPAPL